MSPGNTVRQVKISECHGFLRMLEFFNLSDCRFQVPQELKAMELVLPCGLRKSKPAREMLFLSLLASHLLSGGSNENSADHVYV